MGFHGRERDFTVEHGIITERNRISQEIRTGENGILQEKTGFYGSKLDWTGENGRERERTGFHGRERDFTGDIGFYGRERDFMENNVILQERITGVITGFHEREWYLTGEYEIVTEESGILREITRFYGLISRF